MTDRLTPADIDWRNRIDPADADWYCDLRRDRLEARTAATEPASERKAREAREIEASLADADAFSRANPGSGVTS